MCLQGCFLLESLRENLFRAVSWLLVAANNPWQSLAYQPITPVSASVCTWLSFLCVYVKISLYKYINHLDQYDLSSSTTSF